MTCRIADWISFRFDDPPAEPACGSIVDHYFAYQITCQLHSVHRKLHSAKTAKPPTRRGMIHVLHYSRTTERGRGFFTRAAGWPCRRIKWISIILCFVDYLAVLESRDADRVARPSKVHDCISSDPELAR